MVKQRVWVLALALLMVAAFAGPAASDDTVPPWWRGLPNTTSGLWLFDLPDPMPQPDYGNYPFGPPTTTIQPIGPWEPMWMNRTGVWPLSGRIDVEIPNSPFPNTDKLIWVQLTWWSATGVPPAVEESLWAGQSSLFHVVDLPLDDGWTYSAWQITLRPNPPFERVSIYGEVWVDQLVIDTWCVPEPGALAVLASGLVGFAGLLRRRR